MTRRAVPAGGAGGAVVVGAAAAGVRPNRRWLKDEYHHWFGPHAHIPSAPEGVGRLDHVYSHARGRTVDLFTGVPHGYGKAGSPPFVLAGADGGVLNWEPAGSDPQRMVTDEMPRWLDARGFDTQSPVAWGWSMGGYGVLRLGEVRPGRLRAVAAFSPDVTHGSSVVADDAIYRMTPLGVWCGRSDPLYAEVRGFVAKLPQRPRVLSYGDGAHTRAYWDSVTLPAFAFLGGALGGDAG